VQHLGHDITGFTPAPTELRRARAGPRRMPRLPPTDGRTTQRVVRCLLLAQPPCLRGAREAAPTSLRDLQVLWGSHYATKARRVPAVLPCGVAGGDSFSRKARGAADGIAARLDGIRKTAIRQVTCRSQRPYPDTDRRSRMRIRRVSCACRLPDSRCADNTWGKTKGLMQMRNTNLRNIAEVNEAVLVSRDECGIV